MISALPPGLKSKVAFAEGATHKTFSIEGKFHAQPAGIKFTR
jgi:hypothetical protein